MGFGRDLQGNHKGGTNKRKFDDFLLLSHNINYDIYETLIGTLIGLTA